MTKRTTTKTASTAATASAAPQALPHLAQPPHGPVEALHQPFEWLSARDVAPTLPTDVVLELVSRSYDVANGVSLALRMLEQIKVDEAMTDGDGNPCRPLLNGNDAGHLLRLAMAATDMLGNDISRFHDFALGYTEALQAGTGQ
ncbi:hypothetical protein [Ideonella sp.]|jgi:hypothetical protein|uniref:hypothetical protein n=1 Tax=Ideonella sp. TaxID=1929293 RepID=UPI0037BFE9BF